MIMELIAVGLTLGLLLTVLTVFADKNNRKNPLSLNRRGRKGEMDTLNRMLQNGLKKAFTSLEFKDSIAEVVVSIFEDMNNQETDVTNVTSERQKEIEEATVIAGIEAIGQHNPLIPIIGRRLYGEEWKKVVLERPEEVQVVMNIVEKTGISRLLSGFMGTQTQNLQNGQTGQMSLPTKQLSRSSYND